VTGAVSHEATRQRQQHGHMQAHLPLASGAYAVAHGPAMSEILLRLLAKKAINQHPIGEHKPGRTRLTSARRNKTSARRTYAPAENSPANVDTQDASGRHDALVARQFSRFAASGASTASLEAGF